MSSAASTMPMSPHKRALLLAAFLFTSFVIATALYARYGYPFALGVYEQQQLGNVERRTGSGKLVEYEDYLRVDPTNLYMRGLLISQLIEFKNPWRALEVAEEGLVAVSPEQRPIAKLLLGRAQIARGKLDEAEATYKEVLETLSESGEAHYGLAHIEAAQGGFVDMRAHYDAYRAIVFLSNPELGMDSVELRRRTFTLPGVTPDFVQQVRSEMADRARLTTEAAVALAIAGALFEERLGRFDEAVFSLAGLGDLAGAPPLALFLRGVYEEEQGNRDAALDFYRRAAEAGDALGKFAAERLAAAPPTEEPEAEE